MKKSVFINSKEILPKQKEDLYKILSSYFDTNNIDSKKFNLIIEDNSDPNILYHYTTLNSFQAILDRVIFEENINPKINNVNSFVLRGTNIFYLNDSSEFRPATKILADLIKTYESTLNIDKIRNTSQKLNEKFWEDFSTLYGILTFPYITSFSEDPDNLPMWNTYGQNGKGIALGIERINFNKLKIVPPEGHPSWIKCLYNDKMIKDFFESNIKDLYNIFELNDSGKIIINEFSNFEAFARYFSTLKNIAYRYEHEWRLVKSYSSHNFDEKVKFHEANGILKPFIEHKLPKSILKEVRIGPCSNIDIAKNSIEMSLKKAGYTVMEKDIGKDNYVKVEKSEIPFRQI